MYSSRNSTPRCARDTSPGRSDAPPPHTDTVLALKCTVLNGRSLPGVTGIPRVLRTIIVSTSSSSVRGGSIPRIARAISVLPLPGEPTRIKLWCPAAAISAARRAEVWPFMSAKSGLAASGKSGIETGGTGTGSASPFSAATSSANVSAQYASTPRTNATSSALSRGT